MQSNQRPVILRQSRGITRLPQRQQPVSDQRYSFESTPKQVEQAKAFNKELRYIQGFRQVNIAPGATVDIQIKLKSPGRMLLGFSVIPGPGGSDISDCQATVNVNNNVMNAGMALQNMNPNFVGSMVFFPTPQPLNGNDNITFSILNNSAANVAVITINCFYLPNKSVA